MAIDAILEENLHPRTSAPVADLDDIFQWIFYGEKDEKRDFKDYFHSIPQNKIHREQIRHLRIVGDADDAAIRHFLDAGLSRGFYLNADGTWLLVILPDTPHLGDYFTRYGAMAESLWIFSSQMYGRDFRKMPNLTELVLNSNPLLDTLDHLDKLTKLTGLYIYECPRLTMLPGLESLTQLTKLTLSGCNNLTDFSALQNLTQLTKLNLSKSESLTALPGLEKLTQLTKLNLSGCIGLTELLGLEKLTQLTYLNLTGCQNIAVLPELNNLIHLSELDLMGCSKLTSLPSLKNLTLLTKLNLMLCRGITTLPEDLRYCKDLRKLTLSFMHLQDLPDWLPEIAESFSTNLISSPLGKDKANISLGLTKVDSIQDMSIFEQPYEMVVEWFRKRAQGRTQPLNEIKVVFLGDGEAGKSHTIARLMNDGGDPVGYVDVRTPGIVIKDRPYTVGDRHFKVHYWDFGGQDIMHSMHRIFLTERTIYVVLVDASIGNQDDRARYWLSNIQSFAKDAPVILVLNKLDGGLQADVNAVDLLDKYKGLKKIVKLSAKEYSQERFNREFKDVMLDTIQDTGYLDSQWPTEWIRVKQELEQMSEYHIRGVDYLKICQKCNVDINQEPLLKWFHDLGISFCYCEGENKALEDYVVLKPNWITNALYIILFNERAGGNGGLVPVDTIRQMLSWQALSNTGIKRVIPDAYYEGYDVNYVLDVFRAFKLSFQKDPQHEFFPMLADVNAKSVAKDYAEDAGCLEFHMKFDYQPPNNLLHRLMVERHSELDIDKVWRTGAKFQLPELGLSAVVVIDGNDLRFFVRHTDPMHRPNTYLAMLKANVDRIVEKMGLKAPTCQLIYKLMDGRRAEFSYDRLLKLHKKGRQEEYCEDLDEDFLIEDILNQSAPDSMANEAKLLDAIRKSCLNIQAESDYYLKPGESGWGMEDKRNRRIRDDLEMVGYTVKDQTQRGLSGTGRGIGELDLLLLNNRKEPWTIIEALRISSGATTDWKEHLDKLLANYNYFGAPCIYLLTYVDTDVSKFDRIWESYQKKIPEIHPGKFVYVESSLRPLDYAGSPQDLKTAICRYEYDCRKATAYHIFVRIPTQNS